ncbi:MAG: glutamate--tRNA ligase, partial [Candidatus Omnitrophica bacterium]|nr:glutamate--tRNA ligase [Candidatus Omnitrophota bacterium]
MIRVRFAPSPTGNLHIGGARTALFNWLYAKSQKGQFILRIEDTDVKRSEQKYLDEILCSLRWLGFDWDEIYYQSKRQDIYKEYADKLVKEGKAAHSEGAIIYTVSERKVKVYDLIRGEIEFDAQDIKDQVLIKSDGTATYNFACVVDDALLNITHVIRGDDHISNTPKQVMLYETLGFSIPKFAHLPLILGKDGGRLSKRTGATAISEYRNMGYLPEALVNYLMLLGWSPDANQEIVPIERAIKNFSIKKVNKTAAVFSIEKLNWINNQYMKEIDDDKLTDLLVPILQDKKFISRYFDRYWLKNVVKLYKARINTLLDFVDWADFLFLEKPKFDQKAKEELASKDLSQEFTLLAEKLEKLDSFEITSIEKAFRDLVLALEITASDLVHPVRAALTGKVIGPGLFETIWVLGKQKTKERLLNAY